MTWFKVPFVRKQPSLVRFQPLAYSSSWPAITHHFWQQEVYPGRRFSQYAILGDDVLIADTSVAQVYELLLKELGVRNQPSSNLPHYKP